MQVQSSFSAHNVSPSEAVPLDLVASNMLTFVMSFNRLLQEFFRNSPAKGAVRAFYLQENSSIEEEYNFKHRQKIDRIATNFDRDKEDLKKRDETLFCEQKARLIHETALQCWYTELEDRFKHRSYCPNFQFIKYSTPAPGQSAEYTFKKHRFFYSLWSIYDIPNIDEAIRDIVTTDCDYALLQRGNRYPLEGEPEPHIRMFARTAQVFAHKKIDEFFQGIKESFSGICWGNMHLFKSKISNCTQDFRKVLLMNACARLYYATSTLLTGSLDSIKKPVQEVDTPAIGNRHRTYSARLDTTDGAFKKQTDILLEVFYLHEQKKALQKKATNFDIATLVFEIEKLTISKEMLSQQTCQFYKETKVFFAAIKDFVTLLEIHLEKDRDLFRSTSLSVSRSPRPSPRGLSLAARGGRYQDALSENLKDFLRVRELFEKIDSYCPKEIEIQGDGYI